MTITLIDTNTPLIDTHRETQSHTERHIQTQTQTQTYTHPRQGARSPKMIQNLANFKNDGSRG